MKAWYEEGHWRVVRFNALNSNTFSVYYDKKKVYSDSFKCTNQFQELDLICYFMSMITGFKQKPPFSIYPELWDNGEWKEEYNDYRGLRLLVKTGRMNWDDAELLNWTREFEGWASRHGYKKRDEVRVERTKKNAAMLHEKKKAKRAARKNSNEIEIFREFEDLVQLKEGGPWYQRQEDGTLKKLPARENFHSIEFARRLYSLGRIDLWQVSSYSWGAVIECIGDAWYAVLEKLPEVYAKCKTERECEKKKEEAENRFKIKMKRELRRIYDMRKDPEKNYLVGAGRTNYHLGDCTSDEINPMRRQYYQRYLPTRLRDERDLYAIVDRIVEGKKSARYIRLQMTCAPDFELEYEQRRIDMETDASYSEFLASGVGSYRYTGISNDLDDLSLEEAKDTIIKGRLTVRDLNMQGEQTRFKYHGVEYGVHLDTRKIYVIGHDLWFFLPTEYYTGDYEDRDRINAMCQEKDDAATEKIEEEQKKLYFAMRNKGKSHKVAKMIVSKHASKQLKKEEKSLKSIFAHICSAVNKKAIPTLKSLRVSRLPEMWAKPILGIA